MILIGASDILTEAFEQHILKNHALFCSHTQHVICFI